MCVPEHVDDSCSKLKETEKERNVTENCIIIKPCIDKYKINTKQLGFILMKYYGEDVIILSYKKPDISHYHDYHSDYSKLQIIAISE